MQQVQTVPLSSVRPDPDQPRKTFDKAELQELANSIRRNGLVQPITVRSDGAGGYIVIAGERRYRAHVLLEAATIDVIVRDGLEGADLRVVQLIENSARADVHPLEEAQAYQRLRDEHGLDAGEIAARVGKGAAQIEQRLRLLTLRPEYAKLFAAGQLERYPADHMAKLSPASQDKYFRLLKAGKLPDWKAQQNAFEALKEAEQQIDVFGLMGETARPAATAEEVRAATALERRIEQARLILGQGYKDGEVVALKKVNPRNAAKLADEIKLIRGYLETLENALRKAAIQVELV